MKRREFLWKSTALVGVAAESGNASSALKGVQATRVSSGKEAADPPEDRLGWFRDAKFGMFIHWGPYSVLGGEWRGNDCRFQDAENYHTTARRRRLTPVGSNWLGAVHTFEAVDAVGFDQVERSWLPHCRHVTRLDPPCVRRIVPKPIGPIQEPPDFLPREKSARPPGHRLHRQGDEPVFRLVAQGRRFGERDFDDFQQPGQVAHGKCHLRFGNCPTVFGRHRQDTGADFPPIAFPKEFLPGKAAPARFFKWPARPSF